MKLVTFSDAAGTRVGVLDDAGKSITDLSVVAPSLPREMGAFIAAGAIQRHLDGQHVAVARGFFEKSHDAVEMFVGMMQQDVALADGGKNVLTAA